MDSTPNLTLPYIISAQAQKHVTHNEAIRALDALVQLMVLDKDLATPPGSPADGNRYIVAASPTGAWSGQAGKVAAWQDGAWLFYAPLEGWRAWVADEDKIYAHNGSGWAELAGGGGGTPSDASVTAPKLATAVPPHGFSPAINLGLAASVAANALTIAIKGADGSDPSSTNPILLPFRSATAATGTPQWRALTAATSLVVSSGSTLGTASGKAFRLWIVLFDDGGTLRLGVVNCLNAGSLQVYPLIEAALASSTAEGGAGGADSAGVIYTGTAVAAKAYRILGFMQWDAGLGTAGTWSAGPDVIQLFGPGVLKPGDQVQRGRTNNTTHSNTTTTIPFDDTIPQNTEGAEFITHAVTPSASMNLLTIDVAVHGAIGTNDNMAAALFQDSTAAALAAEWQGVPAGFPASLGFQHTMLAGTTSSTTFKVRAGSRGSGSATFYINGGSANRFFGGVSPSYLAVTEIMA